MLGAWSVPTGRGCTLIGLATRGPPAWRSSLGLTADASAVQGSTAPARSSRCACLLQRSRSLLGRVPAARCAAHDSNGPFFDFAVACAGVWSVGQKIGDYELLAHLRDGGMASLFLARRLGAAGFTRDVAIKIVHPELAGDAQFRAMFLDEALLSARIQHPNVGHVEELGEIDGTHFLVMEFVHGCSLAQLQRALIEKGRRLAPAFAVRIAMHVADGLHAAHETCDEQGTVAWMWCTETSVPRTSSWPSPDTSS